MHSLDVRLIYLMLIKWRLIYFEFWSDRSGSCIDQFTATGWNVAASLKPRKDEKLAANLVDDEQNSAPFSSHEVILAASQGTIFTENKSPICYSTGTLFTAQINKALFQRTR